MLSGPRWRSSRAATLALLLVAALVGGGIVLSQLYPVDRGVAIAHASGADSPTPASASPGAPSPSGQPAPAPSVPLTARIAGDPVDVAALVAAVPRHGAGPLAFVVGRLHTTPRSCEPSAPLSGCLALRIDGLRGVAVVPDDAMRVWPGDPVPGEMLVLLPRDGRLVYLGSLSVDPAGIPRIDALTATVASVRVEPGQQLPSLHEADGVLAIGAAPCPAARPCPAGAPTLLAEAPSGIAQPSAVSWVLNLTGAQPVQILDGAFGIRPTAVWTAGPFLLRLRTNGAGVAWDVVAREDQGSVLHVVIQ